MIENLLGRGRPRARASSGLTVAQWLKSYLSGGPRAANEILAVADAQELSERTVRSAKAGIPSIIAFKQGSAWWWKDTTVAEPEKPETTEEKILHKLDEVARLTQVPRIATSEGVVAAVGTDAVDEYGFKKATPDISMASVSPLEIIARIKQLRDGGLEHEDIVRQIFQFAYPAAKLPESTIATMLRSNGVSVKPKL